MHDFKLEPAHDLGLSADERRVSVNREPGLGGLIPCHLWWGLVRVYLKAYHRLEVTGREHLPAGPPFVVVANHTSHLDALMLAASLPAGLRRCTFPVSAGDVFFHNGPAALFSSLCLNALPMWRKHAGRHAMGDLRTRLTAGTTGLILFPEGTRSVDGTPGRFKPGIGMLAAGTDVPIVPCRLVGAHEALPKGTHRPRPGKLRVEIGPARRYRDTPNDRDGWRALAEDLQTAVAGEA